MVQVARIGGRGGGGGNLGNARKKSIFFNGRGSLTRLFVERSTFASPCHAFQKWFSLQFTIVFTCVCFAGFKGEQRLGKTGFEERKLSDLDLGEVGGGGGDFGLDMPR